MQPKQSTGKEAILSDLNRTLAQSGPNKELTEEEFNKALRRSGKDIAPGLDTIRYSDKKNLSEEDRADRQDLILG